MATHTSGCLSIAAAACLLLPAAAAHACLVNYHSVDELVAGSPLIFIGKVTALVDLPRQERDSPHAPPCQEATVRIVRVLKGAKPAQDLLLVESGPVATCDTTNLYFAIEEGEQYLFILPDLDVEGRSALRYGYSLLLPDGEAMVKARIESQRQWHTEYLARLERETPVVLAAARKVDAVLQEAGKAWPDAPMAYRIGGQWRREGDEAFEAAVRVLAELAKGQDPDALLVALALRWLDTSLDAWPRKAAWQVAARRLDGAEFASAERARLRRELVRLGVSEADAEHFVANLEDNHLASGLPFPPEPPYAYREMDATDLTTDFILRFHSVGRGAMFRCYGMQWDALGKLQRERLGDILQQLKASDDSQLRLVAANALGEEFARGPSLQDFGVGTTLRFERPASPLNRILGYVGLAPLLAGLLVCTLAGIRRRRRRRSWPLWLVSIVCLAAAVYLMVGGFAGLIALQ